MNKFNFNKLSRRELIKLSFMAGGATLLGGRRAWGQQCSGFIDQTPVPFETSTGLSAIEVFPTSPFILNPFTDELPIPSAMQPGYRQPDGALTPNSSDAWTVREWFNADQKKWYSNLVCAPSPARGMQDCMGARPRTAGI